MPKKGPTTSEWKNWLRQYAQGEFIFQRGKKPQKGSVWAGVLQTIHSCPRHRNPNILNALGNPIECSCGYHDVCCKVQLMSEVYECNFNTDTITFTLNIIIHISTTSSNILTIYATIFPICKTNNSKE